MAENKTQPTKASVDDFLNNVDDEQKRKDCYAVLEMMKSITGEPPVMWGPGIVGFGTYHYKYESGREGDMIMTGFSPRKSALTLYIMSGFDKEKELMAKLGKYKTGKSCLYVKRLSDVDMEILEKLISGSYHYMKNKYSAQ